MEKIKKEEYDYFTEEGELVIKDKKALRDIKEGEVLVSYGKVNLTKEQEDFILLREDE